MRAENVRKNASIRVKEYFLRQVKIQILHFCVKYNKINLRYFCVNVCVITKQTATSGRGFIVSLAHSGYRDMLPRPQKNKLCFSESDFRADSKATLQAKMSYFDLKKCSS